jgi:septum formation protein
MVKQKIILASTSPQRKGLLQQMGIDFKIVPSDYEEDMTMKLSPKELARVLAYGKAKDVADKTKEGIVIGVDTFLVYKRKKLGKPHTKENAYKMLKMFSGKTIEVYSGVALINAKTKQEIRDCEVSRFTFKKLTEKEIKDYIKTREPIDKAGAIAIQGLGGIFIREIKGCYSNIVGFPIHNIYKNLQKMGVNALSYGGWKGE